jgi:hypothetical protein
LFFGISLKWGSLVIIRILLFMQLLKAMIKWPYFPPSQRPFTPFIQESDVAAIKTMGFPDSWERQDIQIRRPQWLPFAFR